MAKAYMTEDQQHGDRRQDRPRMTGFVRVLVGALVIGGGFGALTALVNAISDSYADLESRTYTTSGWSAAEIISVLLDSGWAWAGLAVATGWLVTRAGENRPATLARGAAAGVLALLAATAAYGFVSTISNEMPLSTWYRSESLVWWVASVVLGAPLGAIGACVQRPGVIGVLARSTVPVGAAVQMIVLPPGRNEVVTTIGQAIVWPVAVASVGFIVVRFVRAGRRGPSPAGAESS